jgi:hypothetical protein
MIYADHKYTVLTGADLDAYASGVSGGAEATAANLSEGDIVAVDLQNQVLATANALNATTHFKVVTIKNGKWVESPAIKTADMTATGTVYAAATQQTTVIGYLGSGTTTAFTPEDDTSYSVYIEKMDNDEGNRTGYRQSIVAQYKTSSTSTDEELFTNLATQLFDNTLFEAGPTKYLRIATTLGDTSDAGYALTLTGVPSGNITVTKGTVTVATASDNTAAVSAGDVLEITDSAGVADYYTVAAITATTITLGEKYRGETETIGTWDEVTRPSSPDSLVWGISLTGVQPPFDVLRQRDYLVPRFNVKVMAAGNPVTGMNIAETATASEGSGTYEQAAFEEWISEGYRGAGRAIISSPPGSRDISAVSGAGYATIVLREDGQVNGPLLGTGRSKQTVKLYLRVNNLSTGAVRTMGDTLATIFGGLTIE